MVVHPSKTLYGGGYISIFTPKKYVNFLYVLFTCLNKIYMKTWNYYDFIRELLSGVWIDHVKLYTYIYVYYFIYVYVHNCKSVYVCMLYIYYIYYIYCNFYLYTRYRIYPLIYVFIHYTITNNDNSRSSDRNLSGLIRDLKKKLYVLII